MFYCIQQICGICSQQFTGNMPCTIQLFSPPMKKFSLASDSNLAGEIGAKLLIYQDSITPWCQGYLAIVIKTLSFYYKMLSNHVGAIWYFIERYKASWRLKVLRIFPCYAQEPKNLSLVTELSVASSANSTRTNVEFRTVGGRSGSRNEQPRNFYLRPNSSC